jgi:hypothetical protein
VTSRGAPPVNCASVGHLPRAPELLLRVPCKLPNLGTIAAWRTPLQRVIALGTKDDKFNRLFAGDTSAYSDDHSRADLALCALIARLSDCDARVVDAGMRLSLLHRDKWDRTDYAQRTIARAIASVTGNVASSNEFDAVGAAAAATKAAQTAPATENRIFRAGFKFRNLQSARAALVDRFCLIRGKTVEFYDTVLHRTFSTAVLDAEINEALPFIQTEAGLKKATLKQCLINAERKTVVDGLVYAPGAGKVVRIGCRIYANTFQGFPTATGKMTPSRARPLIYLVWFFRGRRIKRFGVPGTTIGKPPARGQSAPTLTQPVLREPWVRCYIHALAYLLQHPWRQAPLRAHSSRRG